MLKPLLTVAVLLAGFTMPAHADAVGIRDVAIAGLPDERALSAVVWYPTLDNGKPQSVGENPAFVGLPALRGASPGGGAHPLVVLSHGYGGSWRNLSWLANALAAKGYVVAATDQICNLRGVAGQRDGAVVRRPRLLAVALPAQQFGAGGVECVVALQRQSVDLRQRDLRPIELGDGDRPVEPHDG